MATRTIENKRDRMATILIAPFMTCSARMPIYLLMIAAFIPDRKLLGGVLGMQSAVMLGLYVLGFLAAVMTAKLLKSTVLKSGRTPFLLEMPPYRWPASRSLGLRLYDRGMVFVKQAGTIILMVTIVVCLLMSFPLVNGAAPPITHSLLGWIGHTIEPVIKPLGLNWWCSSPSRCSAPLPWPSSAAKPAAGNGRFCSSRIWECSPTSARSRRST
jgi:ferrous iron transport protein B